MFGSDKPIYSSKNDRLNRKSFSQQLAHAILSYKCQDNFTISLCGKWGTGKTSIINMIIEEIVLKTKGTIDKPIIVKFNPWNYSDKSQLIDQFFHTILSVLSDNETNEKLKNAGSALQKYSEVLGYTQYIPVVGKYMEPLKALISGLGENMSEIANSNESLENLKEKVITELSDQTQKIIVIIDDIDRLNNEQIRLVFQLVNCVAGFPNMIYLLSFDRSVVVRALEEEQKCSGEEYLEKIIQVPFNVPNCNIESVQNVFFELLDNIFAEIPYQNFDQNYWNSVFTNCIAPFIKTVRDVNRIINVFRFEYGLMHDETNWIDLLALTTLQVCAPEIYEWVYRNINSLTGSMYARGISGVEQKKNKESAIESFSSIYMQSPELMLQIIECLFPKFCWRVGGYTRCNDTNDELRHQQKLASSERSKYYFRLSLEEIPISKQIITESINDYDPEQLDSFLNSLIETGKIKEYLNELLSYIEDIPQERLHLFLASLLQLQMLNILNEKKGLFEVAPSFVCTNCVWKIFKRLGEEKSFNEISLFIDDSGMNLFSVIIEYIVNIERAYGHIGDSKDYNYRILEENSLKEIELKAVKKIKELSKSENLFDAVSFISIYYFLLVFDKDFLKEYFSDMLQKPHNVAKYLYWFVGHWSGSNRKEGWNFNQQVFDDYITKDEAYKQISSIKNTKEFSLLEFSLKEIVVAFYLWANSDKKDHTEISKDRVDLIVPEWDI